MCRVWLLQDLTCPNILQLDGKCKNLCNCIVSGPIGRLVGRVALPGVQISLLGGAAHSPV